MKINYKERLSEIALRYTDNTKEAKDLISELMLVFEEELKEIVQWQDAKIGALERSNFYLEDSEQRRQEWLRKAKNDAGFDNMESFDKVWAEALKAYLCSKQ